MTQQNMKLGSRNARDHAAKKSKQKRSDKSNMMYDVQLGNTHNAI